MVVDPPAATVVGLALTDEFAALTAGASNVTVAVWVNDTLSVVSLAVKVTGSATVSVTVKVVCPLLPVSAGDGPLTLAVDDADAKLTALPETGTEPVPSSVTVTVD